MEELKELLGDCLSLSKSVREQHGHDESFHRSVPPEAVAYAQSNQEVAEIVKICVRNKKPIIPYGTGTSLEGHLAALQGGVCINISEMNVGRSKGGLGALMVISTQNPVPVEVGQQLIDADGVTECSIIELPRVE